MQIGMVVCRITAGFTATVEKSWGEGIDDAMIPTAILCKQCCVGFTVFEV